MSHIWEFLIRGTLGEGGEIRTNAPDCSGAEWETQNAQTVLPLNKEEGRGGEAQILQIVLPLYQEEH